MIIMVMGVIMTTEDNDDYVMKIMIMTMEYNDNDDDDDCDDGY